MQRSNSRCQKAQRSSRDSCASCSIFSRSAADRPPGDSRQIVFYGLGGGQFGHRAILRHRQSQNRVLLKLPLGHQLQQGAQHRVIGGDGRLAESLDFGPGQVAGEIADASRIPHQPVGSFGRAGEAGTARAGGAGFVADHDLDLAPVEQLFGFNPQGFHATLLNQHSRVARPTFCNRIKGGPCPPYLIL